MKRAAAWVEWRDKGLRIAAATVRLRYVPEYGDAVVYVGGKQAIVHPVAMLIAAPSQIAIGGNDAEMGLTARRFTGTLRVLEKRVGQ